MHDDKDMEIALLKLQVGILEAQLLEWRRVGAAIIEGQGQTFVSGNTENWRRTKC